jgi:SPP1 family predicted phage head-tail adaptor
MSAASQMTERVTIQYPAMSDDGYGGKTILWTDLATLSAQVVPVYVGISERVIAEKPSATAGYRINIRVRSDVTAAMRIVWKSHTLAIHSLHETDHMLSILTYEENP